MAVQTQVLIAHTGQRLQVDISQFSAYVQSLPTMQLFSAEGVGEVLGIILTHIVTIASMTLKDGLPVKALYQRRISLLLLHRERL